MKRPLQGYQKETVTHKETTTESRQSEQQQHQGQKTQRPSAYHENTIKIKEPVLHRKSDVPSGIKRTDDFSLKERKGKKEKVQKVKPAVISKVHREKCAGESRQKTPLDNFSTDNKAGEFSANRYTQPFSARRDVQISNYKKKKFFRSGKEKYSRRKTGRENADTEKKHRNIRYTGDLPAGTTADPNAGYRYRRISIITDAG